jgi:uncharacterized protein YggE
MSHSHFEGTIEVSGTGVVEVAPDEAAISFSVITDGKTAQEAVAANADRTQGVVKAVSDQPNHGVTTGGLGVSPIVRYDRDTNTSEIVGFRATNSVNVVTKVGSAGQIYDAGIGAGASQSSGISFRIQNEAPYREEALQIAVKQAFAEAQIVARTADVELAGPETIRIDGGGGRLVQRAATLDASAAPTPVIPGDLTISASVQAVFRTRR